ncbi:MAG: hypothetical protein Q7J98_08450 [Kiritimatiellia bacterium]|nr:hypothetical protein [Kiritimatiellia bacterium]
MKTPTGKSWLWKVGTSVFALAMAGVAANAGVISAGYYDSFGVKADNSLWGWGYDGGTFNNWTDPAKTQTVSIARAQLGLGPTNAMVNGAYVASPTQSGTAKTWLDVVGGLYRGFGIQSDGSLWTWGYDGAPEGTALGSYWGSSDNSSSLFHYEQRGALGLGAQMRQVITRIYTNITTSQIITNSVMNGLATNQPTQVGSGTSWRQVAAGNDFGLGLQADGSIWSWGSESMTTTPQYDTNGVTVTGYVYQANGQLGQGDMLGTLTNLTSNIVYYVRALNVPTRITAPTSMIYVAAGSAHSAAVASDGLLWTWGKNQGGTYVASVSVSNYIHPWDTNYYVHQLVPIYNTNRSVLGLGDTTLLATNVPARVGSETTWASVSAGLDAQFTLAIKTDGSLWGWGNNGYAGANYYWLEVGGWWNYYYYDQNPTATNTPVFWTYAYGYLGLGSNTLFANTPTRVGTDNNWAMVSAGNAHCLGLKSDGSLYAWGNNGSGRLGIGRADTYVAVPTRIGADSDWVFVSAGYDHSLALKSDGALYAWGANTYAALGDQFGSAYEPVKISSGWGYSAPVIAAAENGGGDYDGDHRTDFVIYDASTGNWLVRLSSGGYSLYSLPAMLGGPGYRLVTADFDGDGLTDPAVYQESTATWLVKLSASGYAQVSKVLGGSGYTAVPADYDGDAKADYAVYNKSTGEWRIYLSGSAYTILKTGMWAGCVPVPMDYDGDMKADLMVYEAATGNWQIMLSGYGDAIIPLPSFLGGNNYLAVPMDYDGDGLADPAVYEKSTGVWQIRLSSAGYWKYDSSVYGWTLGGTGYIPTPADYDGDGLADPAVYGVTAAQWTLMLSSYGYVAVTTTW